MRPVISAERKHAKVWNLLLGHALMAIAIYIAFRITFFILQQIDIPFSINDFAVAASVIVITLYGTSMLLRYDARSIRKSALIDHHEYHYENGGH